MIGNHHLGMKGLYRVGSFISRHRVRQIHAHECDVNVLERAHLWHAFGVAGEIETLLAVSENVAIAASLVVKKLSGLGAASQVVRGDRLNGPTLPAFRLFVGNGLGARDRLNDCRWRQNLRVRLADFFDPVGSIWSP